MTKGRLEAFSDGVIAIALTVMVLELKVPQNTNPETLFRLLDGVLVYALSFVFMAIYWNNHHHMLQLAKHVNGAVLWANSLMLFWLTLVPFTTSWMLQSHFDKLPVFFYGVDLLLAAISYTILSRTLVRANGRDSEFARALGGDAKGLISLAMYLAAIAVAMFLPLASLALYVMVAVVWLVPDKRFERMAIQRGHQED